MSSASIFCFQLQRLEPVDVLSVEEHEADNGRLLVHFERMPTEQGSFQDDSVWVHREKRACCNECLPEKIKVLISEWPA